MLLLFYRPGIYNKANNFADMNPDSIKYLQKRKRSIMYGL